MENVEKDILEERVLPEKQGILASKRYATKSSGTVLRETRVAFCDWCGFRLDDRKATIVCCTCGRKLCDSPSCAIDYDGRHYCEEDLQQILPLNKLSFKILDGLVTELSVDEIKDLAHSKKEDFNSALKELIIRKYVERKGLSFFAYYEVLDLGILAWKTYYRVFERDGDVAHLLKEIRDRLKEVEKNDVKRHDGDAR